MKSMEATIYTQEGKEAGKIALPETVFGLKWNADLVHQVVISMMSSARVAKAHTKFRGEVSGGGKKPWKQKGTGRARHGSIRSPLWPGGGVTHGPRSDKNYDRKVNRKMKTKAIYTILSRKFKDGELLFVDSISLSEPKTKLAKQVIDSLGGVKGFEMLSKKRKNAAFIAVEKKNAIVKQGFGNFGNIELDEVRNINPVDLMKYRYLVISNPKESVKLLEGKLAVRN